LALYWPVVVSIARDSRADLLEARLLAESWLTPVRITEHRPHCFHCVVSELRVCRLRVDMLYAEYQLPPPPPPPSLL